ncbi:MAG TPA: hypothetical protein GX706_00080 [Candidatus Moranbacteria bacterium]|nr:hypothetical protein [Candidatus Moranbacteria bacterium]
MLPFINQKRIVIPIVLGFVLFFGIFIRFYNLNQIPPGVWYDEAYNGLDAIKANETSEYQIFYADNYGREGLFINLIAFSFKIFGTDTASLRFPSALFGSLALLGFYFLCRKLKLSQLVSLMGVFILTSSFWHLNFSRISFHAIMIPALIIWTLYFFFSGIEKNKLKYVQKTNASSLKYFLFSGLILGLGLHSYISFRVAPLIFLCLAICLFLFTKNFWRNYRQPILAFLLGALITAGPLLLHFFQNPDNFTGRTDAISISKNPEAGALISLTKSASFHLSSLLFAGDPNQRHNHYSQPLVPLAWSLLLMIGFWLSAKNLLSTFLQQIKLWQKEKNFFRKIKINPMFFASITAQVCFWLMLLPGIITIEEPPHTLQIIGIIPAVFLMIVIAISYLEKIYLKLKKSPLRQWKNIRWRILQFSFVGILSITILTGFSQIYTYFQIWAKDPLTQKSFEQDQAALGSIINSLPLKENNYLIVSENKQISEDYKSFNDKTVEFTGYPKIKNYLIHPTFTGLSAINCTESQIIFQEDNSWLREQIKDKCPNLSPQKIDAFSDGKYYYWIMN